MERKSSILCVVGTTASGKSARGVKEALTRGGEVISVDSRQVYRGLDIGTEKITAGEMQGVPHHLIDILEPSERYSAGDFVRDAHRLIGAITERGKVPILVGGTHFYFDALLAGIPPIPPLDRAVEAKLNELSDAELYEQIVAQDPRRAQELDPKNRRRLIRALGIIQTYGAVPERSIDGNPHYSIEWIVMGLTDEELRTRLHERLLTAFERGLIDEVRRVRDKVGLPGQGDERLNELGLEYRVVGEFLRGERDESSLVPALEAKLWQYARRQRAWLRKLGQV